MAFTYAGNLISNKPPVAQEFQVGADVYVGQPVVEDYSNLYGHVIPIAAAGATPDTTYNILGVCAGIVNDATYSSTYQADYATYDSTKAAVVANDNKDAAKVLVDIARPGDIYKAPIVKDTIGTALDTFTNTSASTAATTVTHTAGTNFQAGYATIYCRSGANRGLYRVVTSGSTTTKVVTVPFPYTIAENDVFVAAQIKLGRSMIAPDSYFMAIDGDVSTGGNYYNAFCHKIDLETSGEEMAWISFHPFHCWYNTSP